MKQEKIKIYIGFIIGVVLLIVIYNTYFPVQISQEEEQTDTISPQEVSLSIKSEQVTYFENTNGYLAQPKEPGTYPGIILIHEWWGLNDNIRTFADSFAEQGYVALAVDLYNGEVTTEPSQARVLATSVRGDMDGAFANLNGAVTYLKTQPNVQTDKLASIGWCFGGGWSYQMAKNDLGVASSVIYYGQFNPADDLSIMRATIMGHFGEDDASIKVDNVKEFQATLQTLSGEHQIFIYPNSGHAFANEDNPAYVEESANLAWERTLTFLNEELKR